MLTSTTPEDLAAAGQDGAYRCWAAAYPLHEAISIPLGSHDAPSPRLALRWLRERTRNVTDQLDMAYAQPGRYWLRDELGRVVVRWSETEPWSGCAAPIRWSWRSMAT